MTPYYYLYIVQPSKIVYSLFKLVLSIHNTFELYYNTKFKLIRFKLEFMSVQKKNNIIELAQNLKQDTDQTEN